MPGAGIRTHTPLSEPLRAALHDKYGVETLVLLAGALYVGRRLWLKHETIGTSEIPP